MRKAGGETAVERLSQVSRSQWYVVMVLCYVNLINYMDRFTIAGVLDDVQDDFVIGDDMAGLLQTVFIVAYMIFAPIFGYLGDRYSRRWLMVVGVCLWSGTTLLGSYMHRFVWFITCRGMVGIGEASYTTIAPTIISDLFVHGMRSKMLALFYFAIPFGSGLGYIAGSGTATLANNWRWALRVTPVLGVIAVILLMFIKEPVRGESEGANNQKATSYMADIKDLIKNRSFMLSTAGFTCVAFVAGALAWWAPTFAFLGMRMQAGNERLNSNEVAFNFGVITMVAGIVGVPLGPLLSYLLAKKITYADPLVCALGLLLSAPFLTAAMLCVQNYTILTYVLIFLAQLSLNLNWVIVADILLYVVVPNRRSTAEAFQILISHALGDAGSPYMVGLISEAVKRYLRDLSNAANGIESNDLPIDKWWDFAFRSNDGETNLINFKALQYALFTTSIVELFGFCFFLLTALYITNDKLKASRAIHENE